MIPEDKTGITLLEQGTREFVEQLLDMLIIVKVLVTFWRKGPAGLRERREKKQKHL